MQKDVRGDGEEIERIWRDGVTRQSIILDSGSSIPIIPQPKRLSVNPCATHPFRTPYVFFAVTDPERARSKGREEGGGRR